MEFTVNWRPSPLNDLADLWIKAPDLAAVTRAANTIDEHLRTAPLENGESREANSRILFEEPLVVLYEVDVNRREVNVFDVWRWPPLARDS